MRYLDSHAARSSDGKGYEVFVLMEYCSRNGLIDFMNTRLKDMLSEPEILQIACDIGLGIANMHYLSPPLIHRDLKIENVLISGDGVFKLCDFGSVSVILRPPRNPTEFQILDNDIQSHTTAQYRSPEMVDISRGFPIDEKSDIWAFGVFIYKLCYYTTPFEREGNLAILNASFSFPPRPTYSDRLKRVINVTLSEDPRLRPNIFQCLKELFSMRGMDVPIEDRYTAPTSTVWKDSTVPKDKSQVSLPIKEPVTENAPSPPVPRGVTEVVPVPQKEERVIPKVTPMYRGRPVPPAPKKVTAPPVPKKFNPQGGKLPEGDKKIVTDDIPDVESKYPTIEALTKSLEQESFQFLAPTTGNLSSYSSSTMLSSFSKPPVIPAPVSMPTSVSHTPVPRSSDLNLRSSALMGSWNAGGYSSQPASDAWTPAPRPLMVNHSTMTSPVVSRSNTPVIPTESKYDISSSDDEGAVPPARNIAPRPLSSSFPERTLADESYRRPNILVQKTEGDAPRGQASVPELSLIEPAVTAERDKLKVLLTGLSEKSTTVVLEEDDSSELRYLKALEEDGTGRSWRSRRNRNSNSHLSSDQEQKRHHSRSRSRSRHIKSSSVSLKSKINDAFKMFEAPRVVSGSQKRVPMEPLSNPNYSTESLEKYPKDLDDPVAVVRATSFMESEDPATYQVPRPRKADNQQLTSEAVASAPTTSIQKRIQAYINRSPSPPPRRTATGYGIYTDGVASENSDLVLDEAGSKMPLKPPPKPPAKPKHLQSPRRKQNSIEERV